MKLDERERYDLALSRSRASAYPDGEFVGQESFVRASEVLRLARRAGVGPGVSVLDLCCGVAGPGRLVTGVLGCSYLGVDSSVAAVALARERAAAEACRFEVAEVPPLPPGPFDVVMLLETMLAFRDKAPLLREVARALAPGGRFVFTLEEGRPLSGTERTAMPEADTVWLTPMPEMLALLAGAGLRVRWVEECSDAHRWVADSLVREFAADRRAIARQVGDAVVGRLLDGHRLWSDWLERGRARKFAFVAEKAS